MKRRTRFLSFALALVMLSVLFVSQAFADGYALYYWDPAMGLYMYNGTHTGIVLCTQLTVREKPSTSAASLGTVKNGHPMLILGISQIGNPNNAFYLVDLPSCGAKNADPGSVGYVKASLVKMDPYFVATTKSTNLYATPWSTDYKNGEQNNRFFLVIEEYPNWYAVQTANDSAGTSFIRTSDVGWYSSGVEKRVITWETPVYDETTWAQIQTVKRLTVASFVTVSGDYTLLVFNEGKSNQFRGWVPTYCVAPLVN